MSKKDLEAITGVGHDEPPEDRVLAVGPDRAARMLGMSRANFYINVLDKGLVRSLKVGRRRLIPMSELQALLAQAA